MYFLSNIRDCTDTRCGILHIPSWIDGRPWESDKSGPHQVESDEKTPFFFHRIDFRLIVSWQIHWSTLGNCIGKSWWRLSLRLGWIPFMTLYSVLSRKTYWRNFSLVSISGRIELLQAIGFISLMNTINHVCLLSWTARKLSVKYVTLLYKGGKTSVMCWFYSWPYFTLQL